MQFKQLVIFFLGLLALVPSLIISQTPSSLPSEIDKKLETYYKNQAFNGNILIAKGGKILYEASYGFANQKLGIKNQSESKFLIGSATKSFTAIAILQAFERGLLDLHTPIQKYLPELNNGVGKLTLHHLMKNSSGLPVHLNRVTELSYRDISSRELIQLYQTLSLSFAPGSQYEYSNLNYQLCALVLERVSGLSYQEYLQQYVFRPLNMNNSGVERTKQVAIDKAIGYQLEEAKLVEAQRNYMSYAMGGGDIYSTALDLLKWDQALYTETLLSPASKELLFDGQEGQFGTYGYGFKVKVYERGSGVYPEGKLVRHGGSMFGYICNIHRYLDDQVCIIVLGNMRPYPTMEITLVIEDLLRKHQII